jgi:hypothetical protein
VFVQTN